LKIYKYFTDGQFEEILENNGEVSLGAYQSLISNLSYIQVNLIKDGQCLATK
jgi:hypothetical protein